MKKIFLFTILNLVTSLTIANDQIATCSSPQGYAYYKAYGLVLPNKAGWEKDGISKGQTTLSVKNGKYDILYMDASSRGIISSTQDGANVYLTRKTTNDVQVMVLYPNSTTEIYTFWRTTDGKYQFSQIQNKTEPVPKSAVYIGNCSFINFSLIK